MHALRHRAFPRRALSPLLVSAVAFTGLAAIPFTAAEAHAAAGAAAAPRAGAAERATGTVCTGSTCVATFEYSGSVTTFTVPPAVTSLRISASGAEGGSPAGAAQQGSAGGKGGTAAGTTPVTPGAVFTVLVGAKGAANGNNSTAFGGGGSSGNNATLAGGGGGGSFVFTASGSAVVVGGGGGGGTSLPSTPGGAGGAATGAGGNGTVGFGRTGSPAGGGTQSAGGAGGTTNTDPSANATATAGSPGTGTGTYPTLGTGGRGNTVDDQGTNPAYNGAGGGGGFYGGGGAATRSSGGGGSSYAAPGLTGVTSSSGSRSDAGVVTFTWTKAATTTSLDVSPASPTTLGTGVTLTATVSEATGSRSSRRASSPVTGIVDFTDGANAIAGCQDVALSSGTATCTLQPTTGSHSFKATLDSATNQSYDTSSSSSVAHTVLNPVTITTTTIAGATVGQAYDATLAASNGTAPYTWSLDDGSLPDGVQLTAAGHLVGTSTQDGTFPITVKVTDSATPAASDLQDLSLVVVKGDFTVGAPTITGGPATVGTELTCAAPSGTPGTASFEWLSGAAHAGDGATYTPVPGDVGAVLRCVMSVARDGYNTASSSAMTAAVVKGDFTVGAPTITGGPATVGTELTCAAPSGTPGTASFEWLSGAAHAGDGATYTPTAGDLEAVLRCVMSVARDGYNTASSSAMTAAVVKGDFTVGAPTITGGPATVGTELTCAAPSGTPGTASFEWLSGAAHAGDGATYTPVPGDVGAVLRCVMSVARDGYNTASSSAMTAAVVKGDFTVGAPTITGGPATVGTELTCAAPSGTPGTASFEWLSGAAHAGDGATYTPTAGDLEAVLRCVMSVARDGYNTASSSAMTAAVVKGDFTVGAPTITGGPATVGTELTCAAPSGTPGTASFEWLSGAAHAGDGATYTPTAGDLEAVLRCVMSVARDGYNTATDETSTDPVVKGTFTTGAPVITGTAQYGQVLTCLAAPGTTGEVSYSWFRDAMQVADGAGYVPGVDDIGSTLTCVVTVSVAGYHDATNDASTPPVVRAPAGDYTVSVAGRAKVGLLLRATINPDPTVVTRKGARAPRARVDWQWYADGRAVPGATRATFRPGYAQLGSRLVARATVVRPGFETPTTASSRTGKVALRKVLFTAKPSRVKAGGVISVMLGRLREGQRFTLALGDGTALAQGRVPADGRSFEVDVKIPGRIAAGERRLVLAVGAELVRSLPIEVR